MVKISVATQLALIIQRIDYLEKRTDRVEKIIYSIGAVIFMAVLGALLKLVIIQ